MKNHLAIASFVALSVGFGTATAQNGLKLTNGVLDYVDVPYDATLCPKSGVTVEAWVKYDENLGAGYRWPTIVRQNPNAGQESILFRVDASNNLNRNLRWWVLGTSGSLNVLWQFPQGRLSTWTHVAGTYDGNVANLIVDGAVVASVTKAGGPLYDRGGAFKIGCGDGTMIETWNGELDEVRIWPYARTAAEIKANMNDEMQRVPGLVSTWNFNNAVTDSSGKNNGAWVGTAQYATNTLTLRRLPVVSAFVTGAATMGCQGTGVLGINSVSEVGNTSFGLSATAGAPSSASAFLLCATTYTSALKILGLDIWVDIGTLATTVGAPTGPLGTSRLPLPIPNDAKLQGAGLAIQALHLDATCTSGVWSSTPALSFSVR
ncbi:MAG: LamG domain-containing protein [Planctomycetes bacterium]|nr:LamG domain-containing protein [Planctomycetota bacterium]